MTRTNTADAKPAYVPAAAGDFAYVIDVINPADGR